MPTNYKANLVGVRLGSNTREEKQKPIWADQDSFLRTAIAHTSLPISSKFDPHLSFQLDLSSAPSPYPPNWPHLCLRGQVLCWGHMVANISTPVKTVSRKATEHEWCPLKTCHVVVLVWQRCFLMGRARSWEPTEQAECLTQRKHGLGPGRKRECVCGVCTHARVLMCLTLWDPMDCSLPGSFVHEIFQARILGEGCHFLLQGISLTRVERGLLHRRQILYCLSHQGSRKTRLWRFVYFGRLFSGSTFMETFGASKRSQQEKQPAGRLECPSLSLAAQFRALLSSGNQEASREGWPGPCPILSWAVSLRSAFHLMDVSSCCRVFENIPCVLLPLYLS